MKNDLIDSRDAFKRGLIKALALGAGSLVLSSVVWGKVSDPQMRTEPSAEDLACDASKRAEKLQQMIKNPTPDQPKLVPTEMQFWPNYWRNWRNW